MNLDAKIDKVLHILETKVTEHEARLRVLEHKRTAVSALAGAVASVLVALIAALAGCRPPPPAVPGWDLMHQGTVTIELDGDFHGTGWYAARAPGDTSFVVTAGHVCDDGLITAGGKIAIPVVDLDSEGPEEDVCVLWVLGTPPAVLPLGEDPSPGDVVWYHGYPAGRPSTYTGVVESADPGGVAVSMPGFFGASGSAVLSRGRVVGILVQGNMRFTNQVYLTPVSAVRRALAQARASFIPDMP